MRSFAHLMSCDNISEERYVELSEAKFMGVLRLALTHVFVDEDWYLDTYPDVADAVLKGSFNYAKDHYIEAGYTEGRLPHHVEVDEAWYINEYPDVAAAIRPGAIFSAQKHFEDYGYREGRLPCANWSLVAPPKAVVTTQRRETARKPQSS
ncbi:MAG: hypothetical protein POH28_10245 [Acidocella sp.]|nr:hypothetical protein [Acidocella sp.]